ncbi:uncharacterized protein LOC123404797 isoform X1 [Hordeum vulgare subsp. vulgare]|uniref:uncharacterized protein LOC123404797 isoform X1 n=1 Tax=Hordeum vulgare subsp. vulgare TaxID=112509 RepID=UPI001D1A550A|nr:uncharacterized protein LOC123404797 isoform X1 [Hordeum vulgare subsp. vulgare]
MRPSHVGSPRLPVRMPVVPCSPRPHPLLLLSTLSTPASPRLHRPASHKSSPNRRTLKLSLLLATAGRPESLPSPSSFLLSPLSLLLSFSLCNSKQQKLPPWPHEQQALPLAVILCHIQPPPRWIHLFPQPKLHPAISSPRWSCLLSRRPCNERGARLPVSTSREALSIDQFGSDVGQPHHGPTASEGQVEPRPSRVFAWPAYAPPQPINERSPSGLLSDWARPSKSSEPLRV